jgi:serine/threonine protein kinase
MTTVFQRVGPYEIVREIGRGGMAAVFLADDTRHSRQVALKLVPVGDDREARDILDAERQGARLQQRLAETCGMVPRVFEEGDHPPYYFIAMEYVHGENLSELIGRGPVAPRDAVRIASDLCRFLDAAHQFSTTLEGRTSTSLVHGDLKPRNVRIADTGEIKILDFGIAKALSLSRKVTRNDFGSMPYLSPERLDSTEVDKHADLWALGVILYELLTGALPFNAVDTRRLEQQIRSGYHRRPLPATTPAGLQAIVAKLLAPVLSDRYPAAAAVLGDLARFDAGEQPEAQILGFPACLDEAPTRRTHRPDAVDAEVTRRTDRSASAASVTTHTNPARWVQPTIAPAKLSTLPLTGSRPPAYQPAPVPVPVTPVPVVPASMPQSAGVQKQPRRRLLRTFLLIAAFYLVANEFSVAFEARRASAAAMTRDLESLSEMWPEYGRLSDRSHLRMGIMRLERSLIARVTALTDDVIANYRDPRPTVRERQWRAAQRHLQEALVLAPDNQYLKASLRYCEGHIYRIDGEAEKLRRRTVPANQLFTQSVSAFREAAELRRDWADPFLGLFRTFIYGMEDIDRAADAIRQAQKLGYTTGDRETAQLAYGYRMRGDSLWLTARQFEDMPQELEHLHGASEAYRQAHELYMKIPSFPGVADSLRRTERGMERIADRRLELSLEKEGDDLPELPAWR